MPEGGNYYKDSEEVQSKSKTLSIKPAKPNQKALKSSLKDRDLDNIAAFKQEMKETGLSDKEQIKNLTQNLKDANIHPYLIKKQVDLLKVELLAQKSGLETIKESAEEYRESLEPNKQSLQGKKPQQKDLPEQENHNTATNKWEKIAEIEQLKQQFIEKNPIEGDRKPTKNPEQKSETSKSGFMDFLMSIVEGVKSIGNWFLDKLGLNTESKQGKETPSQSNLQPAIVSEQKSLSKSKNIEHIKENLSRGSDTQGLNTTHNIPTNTKNRDSQRGGR
jgi:hypothetical protein